MKPGVFITVDVECSMGGAWGDEALRPVSPLRAVWGRYGDRELGLRLIVETLKQHGLAATFFVETYMAEQGHAGFGEEICRYLADNGQDVQLHIHPNHMHYGRKQRGEPFLFSDQMADLPPTEQRELLEEGALRIERWTGRRPTAFRAGNMGASEKTLAEMRAAGLLIDSSYTFVYLGGQCRFADPQRYNGSKWYGDVLELALSGFLQPRVPGLRASKPLDLMGVSFEECREATRRICAAGADAVLILHSFSLFKVRNYQYDGGRLNRIVARRFRRLCRWLAEHAADHPVRTFTELAQAVRAGKYEARAVPPPSLTGPVAAARAVTRKLVQGFNCLYWT